MIATVRALYRLVEQLLNRGHDDPHYDCLTDTTCDGLNEPGVGHVCACGCRRCDLSTNGGDVCVCPGCDVAACGLHGGVPAASEEMR